MFKKTLSYLLCTCLVGSPFSQVLAQGGIFPSVSTIQDVTQNYPNASVIHVSEKEYPGLEQSLRQRGYEQTRAIHLAQAESQDFHKIDKADVRSPDADCGSKDYRGEEPGQAALRVSIDFTNDMMNSSGRRDDRSAAVVFVVVGTIVVFVWALYLFRYLYDISVGNYQCRWSDIAFSSTSTYRRLDQYIHFYGVQYQTGASYGSTNFGVSLELGNASIYLTDISSLQLSGLYWMVGPVLQFRMGEKRNPSYFHMSFRAGSTENTEVGVIGEVRVGFHLGISDNAYIGLDWGAMNLKLKETESIISNANQFDYIYGVNVGYSF